MCVYAFHAFYTCIHIYNDRFQEEESRETCSQAATQIWVDDMDFTVFGLSEEHLETLRIVGDNSLWFGSFPTHILSDLEEAGLFCLLVEPERQILPRCYLQIC